MESLETPFTSFPPADDGFEMEHIWREKSTLVLEQRATSPNAKCPGCGHDTTRIHSRYSRTLDELPMRGVAVRLRLGVRRFRCTQASCKRSIFTERLPAVASPYARRTIGHTNALTRIGATLGGEAGARLSVALGLAASADTIHRLVHTAPVFAPSVPRVLGVDDWVRKRGHTYGTILVDLERHAPVDLLPDRTAQTLAQWFVDHPGVEIVSRDRAEAYAQAARQGAPGAVQVADRWHLLKNVGEALERVVTRHRAALTQATASMIPKLSEQIPAAPEALSSLPMELPHLDDRPENSQTTRVVMTSASSSMTSDPAVPSPGVTLKATRRAHRLDLYERARTLHAEGSSVHAISTSLGLARPTVRKYIRADAFPERAPRRTKIGAFSEYETYLRQQWTAGVCDAVVLWRQLRDRGFRGTLRTVQRHVASWRNTERKQGRERKEASAPAASAPGRSPSPHQVRWWLLTPVEQLPPDQRRFVAHLTEHSPSLASGQQLTIEFADLTRARDVSAFDLWLSKAETCELAEFRDLAAGLRRDYYAVRAALSYPWSNGQTEGQVTKLKMLKRQMYGRASVALLRQRLLLLAS